MSSVTLAPPNAILFLFDRGNKAVTIPPYVDGQLVASNDSCVSVGTQAAVDGEVTVSLEATAHPAREAGLRMVFSGSLKAPTRKVAIVTAEEEMVLECSAASENAVVEVWVDDLRNPARVAVVAR